MGDARPKRQECKGRHDPPRAQAVETGGAPGEGRLEPDGSVLAVAPMQQVHARSQMCQSATTLSLPEQLWRIDGRLAERHTVRFDGG